MTRMIRLILFIAVVAISGVALAGAGGVFIQPKTTQPASTIYLDTFNEAADTTNIAAHTMDIGAGWDGTDKNDGKLRINGTNKNLEATDNLAFYTIWVSTPGQADYCTSWDFVTGATAGADGNGQIRYDYAGSQTGYYAGADKTGKWYLFRSPTDVLLASGTISSLLGSFATGTTYTAKLCGVGTTITYSINSTVAKSVVDTNWTTAGKTGIGMAKTSYQMDNFKVTTP